MSRDSEAPRDEAQPLTKEEREMHVNLSRRVVQAGYPTYSRGYVSDAAVILAYEALVQRLEAEKRALVEGKVWPLYKGDDHEDGLLPCAYRTVVDGRWTDYSSADEALAAYLTP